MHINYIIHMEHTIQWNLSIIIARVTMLLHPLCYNGHHWDPGGCPE